MACFITPLVAGLVVGILSRVLKSSGKLKLNALSYLLLGGAVLLAVEHAWHGEIALQPPYLTALMEAEGGLPVLLREVGIVGGSMVLATAALWLAMLYTYKRIETKAVVLARQVAVAKG